ncbi:unnamed protein product [Caenorhabditis angaria]|uniref:Uncharacterized protein n=1 Tax=Caenorhabditis angaria TaxID=860376 RepID=A0A9P1N8F4_9PELO|nr:unnamed protein product [Caenorhabditis angaria]
MHLNNVQPLQASSLIPPSDHQLDLDTSSLDTLMHSQSQNILMQLYGDVDGPLGSRHGNGMLSGLDDASMLENKVDSQNSVNALNMQLPMQMNLLNFRQLNSQQLPSVHHLTSTSLPSVSSNMDYGIQHDNTAHSQYIVTSQPDMMLSQQQIGGYQPPLDNCVLLTTGQEYVPNFDYSMINQQYQMGVPDQQQQQQQQSEHHQQSQDIIRDEKVLPYEQW